MLLEEEGYDNLSFRLDQEIAADIDKRVQQKDG